MGEVELIKVKLNGLVVELKHLVFLCGINNKVITEDMKQLTDKEEELMRIFWERGALYVRDIVDSYPDPKPHFNTISTFVRLLESKGYLTHTRTGNTYLYSPVLTRDDYSRSTLRRVVDRYFGSSIAGVVSALFKDEHLSDSEIRDLIEQVASSRKND